MYHCHPIVAMAGMVPYSYPSRGANSRNINGLTNAKNTNAEVCIPIVLVNESIAIPVIKPIIIRSHGGVSKGKSTRNKMYIIGYMFIPKSKLFITNP